MQIIPAVAASVICGVVIYAGSIVINARVRPMNMRVQGIIAVITAVIVYFLAFYLLNYVVN